MRTRVHLRLIDMYDILDGSILDVLAVNVGEANEDHGEKDDCREDVDAGFGETAEP